MNSNGPAICVFLMLVCVTVQPVSSQEISNAEIATRIDEYVKPFVEAGHLSGTLLVARGEEVLYEQSWGMADRESKRAFTPRTPGCIASVTKPTTVMLVAQLVESGQLSLNDPISKWVEDFPGGDKIQVQHLLTHRAGIPHRLTTPEQENVPRTAVDMVELARTSELDFPPGSKRNYSSGGFAVLIRVLELASGKTYEELLQEQILGPLNLVDTVHPGPGVSLESAALSYRWTVEGQQPSVAKDYSFLIGAGALFSTPRDMLKIARALIDGKFGKQARGRLLRGGKLKWNGITNNYRAFLEYDAETDLTVAMISNQMVGANDLLRQVVPRIVAGEVVDPPTIPRPKPVSLPDELLERYAGSYRIGGGPMPVRASDGALFANDWILIPVSETSFYSPQDYATVTMVLENERRMALDWSGARFERLGPLKD